MSELEFLNLERNQRQILTTRIYKVLSLVF
jgi:hypothetical protein